MAPLSQLPDGAAAEVVQVVAAEPLRRRLLDLGFVPGTVVVPLRAAPLGGMRAYRIRGSTFAIRSREASQVTVEQLPERLPDRG